MSAKNIIILGDFNAGGTYIRSQDWEKNRLRGPGFTWLIPDHVDTTATNTLAAYDRLTDFFYILAINPCEKFIQYIHNIENNP